ncbi:MAG: HP0729 family protein, partial [Campylobacterales bacterium]
MPNLLILYNPYYQSDVIEQHLAVLREKQKVAFGKVRSKIKAVEHQFEEKLQDIYANTSDENHLQLFLTDYSNLFVTKVEKITSEDMSSIAPRYYLEKNLEVEQWYIITDIKELVRNDFENIRDNHLANFTTPNFDDHTYAVYGNSYVYPLVVDMKKEIDTKAGELEQLQR